MRLVEECWFFALENGFPYVYFRYIKININFVIDGGKLLKPGNKAERKIQLYRGILKIVAFIWRHHI